MDNIKYNLKKIHDNINTTATKCGRNPSSVNLLCVSKTKPSSMIKEAYAQGERHFGESYAVEASNKIEELKQEGFNDIKWHFIGPIQKNKTKLIATHFDIVESLDREIIATRLNEQRPDNLQPLEVLIEVNISNEQQKSGCSFDNIESLVNTIAQCPKLKLKGFMGIARENATKDAIIKEFASLKKIFDEYKQKINSIDTLSLGMTADLDEAISVGSTEVRIGTAIFGQRTYSASAVANKYISFIGGGNMSTCIFDGIAKSYSTAKITVSGPHIEKLQHFKDAGAFITTSNIEATKKADVIFLGVKPQILTSVLEELSNAGIDFTNKLVISMAAGFKLSSLNKLTHSQKLIRIMPNTPAKIGLGVIAVSYGENVNDNEKILCRELLTNLGKTFEGSESDLNVIGAICGSGPAFVFLFMESLCNEGIRYGIKEKDIRAMVELTLQGSAALAKENKNSSLQSLREAVTSKGGTTYEGLKQMTAGNFEQTMENTIKACLDRTAEFEKLF